MPEVLAHAPLLLGLVLNNMNNNHPKGVTAGTVVVHEQIAEANYLHGMGEFHDCFSFRYRSSRISFLLFPLFFVLRSINPTSSSRTCNTDQPIAEFYPR